VGELQSAIDSLTVDDLQAMFGPQLIDRVGELLIERNRLDAELARTVRAAEVSGGPEVDGAKTMRSWLIGRGGLTSKAATQVVGNGRALPHLPAVAGRFAGGAITADRVAVIAPIASEKDLAAAAAQGVDVGEVDAALAALAVEGSLEQLTGAVQHYRDGLDPDGPEPDPTENRTLVLSRHSDGFCGGRFMLDPVGGEKLEAALESIVQADRPAGDTRSRAQQLADALVQLADNQLASGDLPILRTVKPTVVVTIPLSDLMDPNAAAAGRSGFGAVFSAARTRMLACDSTVIRLVFGPDSAPLDVGRTQRVVPPHIRRAVEFRDRHCVFAGCRRPAHHCDVHHLVHWIDDGPTSLANSALLCERHHTQVHHGFTITRTDGRWHTHRPDGTEIHPHIRPGCTAPARIRPGAPPRSRPRTLLPV
jgi:hypothetical protein